MLKNRLNTLFREYQDGKLKKNSYIRKMHKMHGILWEYQDFIRGKNVHSILISKDGLLVKTTDGIVLSCDPLDERALPIEILNFGDYESAELSMIKKFLRHNDVVLDIGANLGWYSLNFSKLVPNGRVMAFEPVKNTFEYLKKNISLNNLKNVRIYNFGLADKTGASRLYYDPKLWGVASLRNLRGSKKKKEKVKCYLKRLDDFILGLSSRINFIKCDVEGAELLVIKGGLRAIKETKPVIFLEILRKWSAKFGYHPNDLIQLLKNIGYDCYYVKGGKLIRIRKITDNTVATNFFFLDPLRHRKYVEKLTRK